jgi:serine/threonine protein kinase
MAQSALEFGKYLVTTGLLTNEQLNAACQSLSPKDLPQDDASLAKLLVAQSLLTPYQSKQALSGRAATLVLDDYILLEQIGVGGMGHVFKARHRRMKRFVAIKFLPPQMTKNIDAIKRFEREVRTAAMLSHPNIVQSYDAGVHRGRYYLVMEYVNGKDLSSVLTSQGLLAIADAADYAAQTARGLAYAHDKNVMHRDIKPSNLLVNTEGQLKILDMGLARLQTVTEDSDELTESGRIMGTADYMSPEQSASHAKMDGRSDIYSLGCTLYRLLTGQHIYDEDTVFKKIMAHRNAPIPDLLSKRPEVPVKLDAIYHRMVAKNPDERYQKASELADELEAFRSALTSSISYSGSANQLSATATGFSAPLPESVEPRVSPIASSLTIPPGFNPGNSDSGIHETVDPVRHSAMHTAPVIGPDMETKPSGDIVPPPVITQPPIIAAQIPAGDADGSAVPKTIEKTVSWTLVGFIAAMVAVCLLGAMAIVRNVWGSPPNEPHVVYKVPSEANSIGPGAALSQPGATRGSK